MKGVDLLLNNWDKYWGHLAIATDCFYSDICRKAEAYILLLFHRNPYPFKLSLFSEISHGYHLEKDLSVMQKFYPSGNWTDIGKNLNLCQKLLTVRMDDPETYRNLEHNIEIATYCSLFDERGKGVPNNLSYYFTKGGDYVYSKLFEMKPNNSLFYLIIYHGNTASPRPVERKYLVGLGMVREESGKKFFLRFTTTQKKPSWGADSWEYNLRAMLSSDYLPDILYGYDEMLKMLGDDENKWEKLIKIFLEFFPKHLYINCNVLFKYFQYILMLPEYSDQDWYDIFEKTATSRRLPESLISGGLGKVMASKNVLYSKRSLQAYEEEPLSERFPTSLLTEGLREALSSKEIAYAESLLCSPVSDGRMFAYSLFLRLNSKSAEEIYTHWHNDTDKNTTNVFGFSLPDKFYDRWHLDEDKKTGCVFGFFSPDRIGGFLSKAMQKIEKELLFAREREKYGDHRKPCAQYSKKPVSNPVPKTVEIKKPEKKARTVDNRLRRQMRHGDLKRRLEAIKTACDIAGPTPENLEALIPLLKKVRHIPGAGIFFQRAFCKEKAAGCLDIALSLLRERSLTEYAARLMIYIGQPEHVRLLEKVFPNPKYVPKWAIMTLKGEVEGLKEELRKLGAPAMHKNFLSVTLFQSAFKRAREFRERKKAANRIKNGIIKFWRKI